MQRNSTGQAAFSHPVGPVRRAPYALTTGVSRREISRRQAQGSSNSPVSIATAEESAMRIGWGTGRTGGNGMTGGGPGGGSGSGSGTGTSAGCATGQSDLGAPTALVGAPDEGGSARDRFHPCLDRRTERRAGAGCRRPQPRAERDRRRPGRVDRLDHALPPVAAAPAGRRFRAGLAQPAGAGPGRLAARTSDGRHAQRWADHGQRPHPDASGAGEPADDLDRRHLGRRQLGRLELRPHAHPPPRRAPTA
jgi:hypothetical protein